MWDVKISSKQQWLRDDPEFVTRRLWHMTYVHEIIGVEDWWKLFGIYCPNPVFSSLSGHLNIHWKPLVFFLVCAQQGCKSCLNCSATRLFVILALFSLRIFSVNSFVLMSAFRHLIFSLTKQICRTYVSIILSSTISRAGILSG